MGLIAVKEYKIAGGDRLFHIRIFQSELTCMDIHEQKAVKSISAEHIPGFVKKWPVQIG